MEFSNNLQQLRKKANISQEKLAEQLHITRQAISKWESGQSVPDADTCLKLCETLGVSPNQLLLGEDKEQPAATSQPNKSYKMSDFSSILIFLTAVLLCGTALMICNLYNGSIFEPNVHTMALLMVQGSIFIFALTVILRFALPYYRQHQKKDSRKKTCK